jgi:DNA-binding MarR family transcriptional regulator
MALSTNRTDRQAVKAWLSVVRAYHHCDAVMAARLATLGVRTAEHEILANLVREPGISQQALAARCFTAKSHVSALLRTMEERGWVRREADPVDARARRLYVTRAGEAIARRTLAVQAEIVQAMTKAAPSKDLAFIEETMNRVSERLEAMQDADVSARRKPG